MRRAISLLSVAGGAVALRAVFAVGFANYDTLYALVWGAQASRGEDPQYAVAIAPTPHPLMELVGVVAGPLGAHAATSLAVWIGYVALSACGYVTYRLGSEWFNRPVGALAAVILLTRTPIVSYGSRAYIDVPFLALMLGAMLVESRRRRAGAPVLVLLALAGLLRPEAWVFAGLYWLYLAAGGRVEADPGSLRVRRVMVGAAASERESALGVAQLGRLAALVVCAPLIWVLSDLAVTGNAMWSLTHTMATAATLHRVTGIANVPQYIPRRIGEIVRPVELAGAALGGVLSLLWLRARALMGAAVGVVAVLVFALLATVGLPIDTRYAFLAAAILCTFCAVGAFGWMLLSRTDPVRRYWAAAGLAVLVALAATIPAQYRSIHTQLRNLTRQESAQNSLLALVRGGMISARCAPVGVPNHAPIPLLALYLKVRPGRVLSAQVQQVTRGTYVEAANEEVRRDYILDPHEPRTLEPGVPAGFRQTAANRDWLVYERCG
ncbi:MAG: hypothetical protein KGJ43_02785 [Acidobacteriota bacterium]|nr:hypothetical protein [Acidobacteriota bacterium]